jgi:hypothetical protein
MIALAACVLIAQLCQAVTGFGGMIVAVSLAAQLFPLPYLLAVLIPINLVLSAALVLRHTDAIEGRFLLTRVLPWTALGMPLGLLLAGLDGRWLKLGFGVLVMLIAAGELWQRWRGERQRALHPGARAGLLALAGVIQGLYGSSGPLFVYVVGRELPDKRAFRTTLSLMWLVLDSALLASLAWRGQVTLHTAQASLLFLPIVAASLFVGEWLFRKLDAKLFRLLTAALLLVAGALLVIRALARGG